MWGVEAIMLRNHSKAKRKKKTTLHSRFPFDSPPPLPQPAPPTNPSPSSYTQIRQRPITQHRRPHLQRTPIHGRRLRHAPRHLIQSILSRFATRIFGRFSKILKHSHGRGFGFIKGTGRTEMSVRDRGWGCGLGVGGTRVGGLGVSCDTETLTGGG
ncbi:hypothetical protein BC829DRAFT_156503 [Chytridium lagenaria]|nr:hypothetical protein BC829DRAFT_156503 [Chytridium lagenaria]